MVEDILFNGYSPGTLQFLLSIYDSLGNLTNILPPLPDMLAGGKFGLWMGKNDTMVNQYYTINTGDQVQIILKRGLTYNLTIRCIYVETTKIH